jgi:CHAT domain-containing protein/tetratricopeptide (TPR) repeat protein
MKFAAQVGLMVLVNLAIVSGGILPGRAGTVGTAIAQAPQSSELKTAIAEGARLIKEGGKSKTSLMAAASQFERVLQLSRAEDQKATLGDALSNLGAIYRALGENNKALEYYNQALLISRALGKPLAEGYMLNEIGLVYRTLGENQKALEYYNQSLLILRAVGSRPNEAAVLVNMATIYIAIGENRKALECYNQLLQIMRSLGDRSQEATMLNNIGSVYSDLGQPQKALEYYSQALSIDKALQDRAREGTTLNNMGLLYSDLGENSKALEYYSQSLTIAQAVKKRLWEAKTLMGIGSVYSNLGQKPKALEYYNQALLIVRAVGDKAVEGRTLNGIGAVYGELGDDLKALEYFNQALPILRVVEDRAGQASALYSIGSVYADLGEKSKALEYYNQALSLKRAMGNRAGEASALTSIGVVYQSLREKSKALEYYNQALPLQQAVGDRKGEALTLFYIGNVYANFLGDEPKALKYYNQALSLRRAMGDRAGEATSLFGVAHVYGTKGKLPEALQNINASIEIIESLRSELKTDALKTSYFALVQDRYQLKTDILMQLHQQQPTKGYDVAALETVDNSRARVLRELLIQANANINKDVSPDLRQQEQNLNKNLDAKEKQLVQLAGQGDNSNQLSTLRAEIAALYAQRDDLKNTIRASNPAYANLQYPKPTTLKEIQKQLEPDTLMLQYSLGKHYSYLWVIGNNTLNTYILPKRSDIEKTATSFRSEVTGARLAAPPSASTLTQQILAPAANDLGTKRLVIIPDGILHTIPFAALNTPNSTTYTPLITQHEVTNLPSASTISILRSTVSNKPRGAKTIAILADPIFRKDDERLTGKSPQTDGNLDLSEQLARKRTGRDLNLKRLPFTATEAKGILALVPQESERTAAYGFDASYDWVTSPKISQYRYIHLATHGLFDNDKPALSSIILSSFDAQGHDRKAYLRFPELFNLNLPAELVVLSACETGLGNDVPGEGLVGMTRGLMYAGALRISVSLWSVDDQATSDLMQQFYTNLWNSKQSHAESLRAAQLAQWKQGKAPYFWAAFTLQGEWRN